jgi:hypothetical protein
MDATAGRALEPCRHVTKTVFPSRRDDQIEAVGSKHVGKRRADP